MYSQEFDLEVVELFSSDTDSECDVDDQLDSNKGMKSESTKWILMQRAYFKIIFIHRSGKPVYLPNFHVP